MASLNRRRLRFVIGEGLRAEMARLDALDVKRHELAEQTSREIDQQRRLLRAYIKYQSTPEAAEEIDETFVSPPSARQTSSPPQAAEKMLSLLVSPKRLEEALGDFAEQFHREVERHGLAHARRWYWWQALMVGAHGIFDLACRAAKIWSGFGSA